MTKEELEPLEKDFIDFLVVNGITADEWKDLQEHDTQKVDGVIEAFSDVVFESIMRKAQFLEIKTKEAIYAFQCLAEKLNMVGIRTNGSSIDLTQTPLKDAFEQKDKLAIFQKEKPYEKAREAELFDLIQNGCEISDGKLFKELSLLYSTTV